MEEKNEQKIIQLGEWLKINVNGEGIVTEFRDKRPYGYPYTIEEVARLTSGGRLHICETNDSTFNLIIVYATSKRPLDQQTIALLRERVEETDRSYKALAALENFIMVTKIEPPQQTVELLEQLRKELRRKLEATISTNLIATAREAEVDSLRKEDGRTIKQTNGGPVERRPEIKKLKH